MIKIITACISALILPVVKQYFTHYFDSKKIDAYSLYSLIVIYSITIILIYSCYIFLIVEKISTLRFWTFIISAILFALFIVGICISLCTLINNFTIFKNKKGELFEKKSKSRYFFKELIMLNKVTEENQLNRKEVPLSNQKYQCDKYYYQDRDGNSYYEYVYLYKKSIFMRMKGICLKKTKFLILIVLLLIFLNLIYSYKAFENIPYKYITGELTRYVLIICNDLLCIAGCIIISKMQSSIIEENRKNKMKIVTNIKLHYDEKYKL
ncbi:hypothetical protein KJB64_11625 [Staphylococcus cohnii]|uniref:hypothetical protein n=1 Tax=Staphylococcus cohnii TaxID=29382 RepID=UPI0018689A77|nr:hypothetical protein [Staphylococcus cohnii]MCE5034935.1 hypothetical protein [Staphylococcus cohnii]